MIYVFVCLGQWNLTALPVAEESLLLEAEVHLGEFEKTNMDSTESDVEIAEDSVAALSFNEREDFSKSITLNETDLLAPEKELEETDTEPENCDVIDAPQVPCHYGNCTFCYFPRVNIYSFHFIIGYRHRNFV